MISHFFTHHWLDAFIAFVIVFVLIRCVPWAVVPVGLVSIWLMIYGNFALVRGISGMRREERRS